MPVLPAAGKKEEGKKKEGRFQKEGNTAPQDQNPLCHMKTAFTIALTVAAANATSLRQAQPEKGKGKGSAGHTLDVHDTQFIEKLASKYNCREAGASLES